MSIDTILIVVALVLGIVAVVQSQGRNICAWGVVLLAVALLPLW